LFLSHDPALDKLSTGFLCVAFLVIQNVSEVEYYKDIPYGCITLKTRLVV